MPRIKKKGNAIVLSCLRQDSGCQQPSQLCAAVKDKTSPEAGRDESHIVFTAGEDNTEERNPKESRGAQIGPVRAFAILALLPSTLPLQRVIRAFLPASQHQETPAMTRVKASV